MDCLAKPLRLDVMLSADWMNLFTDRSSRSEDLPAVTTAILWERSMRVKIIFEQEIQSLSDWPRCWIMWFGWSSVEYPFQQPRMSGYLYSIYFGMYWGNGRPVSVEQSILMTLVELSGEESQNCIQRGWNWIHTFWFTEGFPFFPHHFVVLVSGVSPPRGNVW